MQKLVRIFIFITTICQAQYIQYGNKLVGTDNSGYINQAAVNISGDGKTIMVGTNNLGSGLGAVWIYTFNGSGFVQAGNKLTSSHLGNYYYGKSVALSYDGKIAVVGGDFNSDGIGIVNVYSFNGINYELMGNPLLGTGSPGYEQQGFSVSISADGKTIITGAPIDNIQNGAVWIFTFNGTNFVQLGSKLVGTGIIGGAPELGWSVSLSADGKTALVGVPLDDQTGSALIYNFDGTNFIQTARLIGTGGGVNSQEGGAVSISANGKIALIGGAYDNSGVGAAWIFSFNGTNFKQIGNKLVGSDMTTGPSYQGTSVSLSADGSTAWVAGHGDNSNFGAVWVYTFNGTNYVQAGNKLTVTDAIGKPGLGYVSLSADAKIGIIGGSTDNTNVGAAWVFTNTTLPCPFLNISLQYKNDNLIIANTVAGASYQWIKNGSDDPGQTGIMHTNSIQNTEYQVRTTVNGCSEISEPASIFKSMQTTTATVIEVITATSCNTAGDNLRLEASPDISVNMNTETGKLNINAPSKSINKLEISNDQGLIIERLPQVAFVDFQNKNPGIYTIKALNEKGSILKMFRVHLE